MSIVVLKCSSYLEVLSLLRFSELICVAQQWISLLDLEYLIIKNLIRRRKDLI